MTLWAIFALFTKHLIIDFPLQGPYQYKNKGTYGHPGGLLHAWLHACGTMAVLAFFAPSMCILLGLIDGLVHYHVDWAKMNLNQKFGLRPDNSEQFWWLLGLDQYAHAVTYILILAAI